jgi:SAM-dependent methyltransferase
MVVAWHGHARASCSSNNYFHFEAYGVAPVIITFHWNIRIFASSEAAAGGVYSRPRLPDRVKPMKLAPPAHLVDRVFPLNDCTAEANRLSFIRSGERSADELTAALQQCGIVLSNQEVLDWGCGPGRVDLRLLERYPNIRLTGVDVDRGSVDWLTSACPNARFFTIPLLPPTQFENDSFDICINHSVLTHLDEDAQTKWLAEIARVLRVNGIFVTSVHGVHVLLTSAQQLHPPSQLRESWARQWNSRKFVWVEDDSHTGSAHHSGYHTTFQDPSTVEALSGYIFEPLQFTFRGDLGFQDLLVLRKRSPEEVLGRSEFVKTSMREQEIRLDDGKEPSHDDLVRVWSMASMSLTRLGNQIARLEDEVLRLRLSQESSAAKIPST